MVLPLPESGLSGKRIEAVKEPVSLCVLALKRSFRVYSVSSI
jgi:hypothetical protein